MAVANSGFTPVRLPFPGLRDPWAKAVGDVNGDGRPDLLVGGNAGGGLVWFDGATRRRAVIAPTGAFSTDLEVVDIDGDGQNDVAALVDGALVWYRGPEWSPQVIDRLPLHDVEVADLDGDGRADIVGRDQSAFAGRGDRVFLFFQAASASWDRRELSAPAGEGLKVADLDGDGVPDIVVNGWWFENPGERAGSWREHPYSRTWTWPHTYIDVADINGDGLGDIVLAPAEHAGERYRLSWFESPPSPHEGFEWREHVIENDIEAVHHFVAVADMDNDGAADVVSAEMHQGSGGGEVKVYRNLGDGREWRKRVIGRGGSHSMRVVDVEGDGDVDLFGANWAGAVQEPKLWINDACDASVATWRRHVVDSARLGRAVFVQFADMDGNGKADIVAGGFWYRNPGQEDGKPWERHTIGAGANQMAAVFDFDDDGRPDVLATADEPGSVQPFVWARNEGGGTFTILDNIPPGRGDFLQGAAVGRFGSDDRLGVALSWHEAGHGVQLLTVPREPRGQFWKWTVLHATSQDEQLSAGDIDGDGDLDLLLGTLWLRNDGDTWAVLSLGDAEAAPDRNRLADINGDGRLDGVVGFEAISAPGDVVWFEQGEDSEQAWRRHLIGTVIGPMSLDVGDVDRDSDLDVVVGEHNLKQPDRAGLFVFENLDGKGTSWQRHTVFVGDEHHDGAQLVDIDGDGDLDIVSIGWGHSVVAWYENPGRRRCGGASGGAR